MRIRWTAPAAQDLYNITRYVQRDNPSAAREVARITMRAAKALSPPRIADARESRQVLAS
jgi:plasmid stabilization system protein ParE